jgi:hypothetical protein
LTGLCAITIFSFLSFLHTHFYLPMCQTFQQVKKLQELVQLVTINREPTSFVLPISSSVVSNPKSISSSAASISPMRQLKSLQIFKTNVKALPFSYQIYGWVGENILKKIYNVFDILNAGKFYYSSRYFLLCNLYSNWNEHDSDSKREGIPSPGNDLSYINKASCHVCSSVI